MARMDAYVLFLFVFGVALILRGKEEKARIELLAGFLGRYRIEALMETLSDGYLRALGEQAPERQAQIWGTLAASEVAIAEQLGKLSKDLAGAEPASMRVSRLPLALPYVAQLVPAASFDFRALMALHARGIERAIDNAAGLDRKRRAYLLTAEMYLMQHSCHWFCKSKGVASARLIARHKTSYAQVLAAVSADTRAAYLRIVGG